MDTNHDAPDGGWGWIITFAAFMVSVILDGISSAFGILFKDLLQYFNEGKSLTSWIISVYNGATIGIGPVAGILTSRFGIRKVAIFGGLLASVSMFLSTFSPNVQVMIFLYGLLGGSGLGLIYFPALVLITQYFSSKRGLAAGIACCGSGVGGFAFAPLMEFLINKYSWQGAVWIVSAIVLNCVVLGALLRPLATHSPNNFDRTRNETDKEPKHICGNKRCLSCSCDISSFFDFEVLKSPTLWLYGMSCFTCSIGFYIPFTFLPDLADSFGMTSQQGAMLIAIIGILNTVGRVAAGLLADRPWADAIKINGTVLITGGVATLFVTKYTQYVALSVYCGVFGITIAVFMTYQPIISLELSDTGQMTSFFGVLFILKGIAILIGAPFAGLFADTTGAYDNTFYLAGISIAGSGLLCLPLVVIKRREIKRREMKRFKQTETTIDDAFEESTNL